MEPGDSVDAVSAETAPHSALGSGVGLHAYDIVVVVIYFVFVLAVGIWVSENYKTLKPDREAEKPLILSWERSREKRKKEEYTTGGSGNCGMSGITHSHPVFLEMVDWGQRDLWPA